MHRKIDNNRAKKCENKMAGRSIQRPFLVFKRILEKSLLEEMCLELQIALKNGLKNVQGAFFADPKKILENI